MGSLETVSFERITLTVQIFSGFLSSQYHDHILFAFHRRQQLAQQMFQKSINAAKKVKHQTNHLLSP